MLWNNDLRASRCEKIPNPGPSPCPAAEKNIRLNRRALHSVPPSALMMVVLAVGLSAPATCTCRQKCKNGPRQVSIQKSVARVDTSTLCNAAGEAKETRSAKTEDHYLGVNGDLAAKDVVFETGSDNRHPEGDRCYPDAMPRGGGWPIARLAVQKST